MQLVGQLLMQFNTITFLGSCVAENSVFTGINGGKSSPCLNFPRLVLLNYNGVYQSVGSPVPSLLAGK
jgi:hypothetical protein